MQVDWTNASTSGRQMVQSPVSAMKPEEMSGLYEHFVVFVISGALPLIARQHGETMWRPGELEDGEVTWNNSRWNANATDCQVRGELWICPGLRRAVQVA